MNNELNLTDDELSLIQTALQLTITSHERYVQTNGESVLDYQSIHVLKDMKELHARLNQEYFI